MDGGVFEGWFILIVFLLGLLSMTSVGRQGNRLHKKFIGLETLVGKTEEEIINAVGAPTSRTAMLDSALLQWQSTGYHIALIFDENSICKGISHEFVHRG